MAMTLTILYNTVFGNKRVVAGTYDANGSANGTKPTGLKTIDICLIANSENTSEGPQIIKNANDTTEGSSPGDIYIAVADSTNSTGYWEAYGSA